MCQKPISRSLESGKNIITNLHNHLIIYFLQKKSKDKVKRHTDKF